LGAFIGGSVFMAAAELRDQFLLHTPGVWQRCSLGQKQPLQQVLFPLGIEYADGVVSNSGDELVLQGLRWHWRHEKPNW